MKKKWDNEGADKYSNNQGGTSKNGASHNK